MLTAAHVVGPVNSPAQVRFPELGPSETSGGPALWNCEVVWSRHDPAVDAALLRIVDPHWQPERDLPALRWGRLVSTMSRVPCEALGFPDVKVHPDQMRDTEHLYGSVKPLGLARARRWDVAVESAPAAPSGSDRSPWAGMSGAGLFCNGLLIGVITQDTKGFASSRVAAVRVEEFAADRDFAALVWGGADDRPELAPAELDGLQEESPPGVTAGSLLRADVETVRFRGRREALARLREWCAGSPERGSSALLVSGRAGEGKTRLVRELSRAMAQLGWAVVHLAEKPDLDHRPLSTVRTPLLLVVDCAERRTDQIRRAVRHLPEGVAVRLLLVARAAGEWADKMARDPALAHLLSASVLRRETVEPLVQDGEGWPDLFEDALTDLATRLSATAYAADADCAPVDWPRAAAAVPRPDFAGSDPVTVLDVQMAALAGLLQVGFGGRVDPRHDPARVLLGFEERYWEARADAAVNGLPDNVRLWAVTVATMCTAADREESERILRVLPGLAGQPAAVRLAVQQWLHRLYGTSENGWSAMAPDRLHEHLAGMVLADAPHLLDPVVPHLSDRQACRVLTVLARAAVDRPALADTVVRLVTDRPKRLGAAAFAVAAQVEAHARAPLDAALVALDEKRGRDRAVADAVQPHSGVLRALLDRFAPRPDTGGDRRPFRRILTSWRSARTPADPAAGKGIEIGAADIGAGSAVLAVGPALSPVAERPHTGALQRGLHALTTAPARFPQLRALNTAARLVQDNPGATKIAGAVAAVALAVTLVPATAPSGNTPAPGRSPGALKPPGIATTPDPPPMTGATPAANPEADRGRPVAADGETAAGGETAASMGGQPPPAAAPSQGATSPAVAGNGPPSHGRLIETLTPDHIASSKAMMVYYGVAKYTPERVAFNDPPKLTATTGAAVPMVAVRDGAQHTIRMAVHVHATGSGPVQYQFHRAGWKLQATVSVPAGDATLWFTDTVHGAGWWHWAVTSVGNTWVLRSMDVYEVTESGPAPESAPAARPGVAGPTPPLFARIDLARIRTTDSALGFDNVYGISPGWSGAMFRPDLYPPATRQGVTLSLRNPDRNPRTFRLVCAVRTDAAGRYELDGQMVAAPAGHTTVQFHVTAAGGGWHSWFLTQTNAATWLFKSCDVH